MRPGSGPGERASGNGSEGSGDAAPAAGGDSGGSGRYPWWDWSDAVVELSPPVRRVAEAVARRVEGEPAGQEPSITPELVSGTEARLEDLWGAVACLRRSLESSRDSAPREEVREAHRRLDEAAGELWAAGAEAEVAVVRDFLGDVARDFRSPLHSSLYLTDTLFRGQSGSLSQAQKQQLSVVHSAMATLLRMSNDLVDFSKSDERGARPDGVEETLFSPKQVTEALEDLLEPITFHRNARLEIEVEDVAYRVGDPQVMNRVLLNLAFNSLENVNVEEGGAVRIRIEGDDDELRARVEDDTGVGDPERIRSLLEGGDDTGVIRRLGGETRGLGLVISGRMIRAVGGEMSVERTDDGWTRLSVALPFPILEEEGPGGRPDRIG